MRTKNLFGKTEINDFIPPAMPYMGNKRKLATKILNAIYSTVGDFDCFYDLFGGGGSMSMAALIAGHKVIYNEINTGICNLMRHLKDGGKLPTKWITRDEFHKHKNGDDWYAGYVKCCWSFGNNKEKGYLFGKDIEELKRQAHEYLLDNGYDGTSESRNVLLTKFKTEKNITDRFELEQLERLQQLQQLEQLEQLERLQQLQRLQQLKISNKSYQDVTVDGKAIVYCDPPYAGTTKYQEEIDHNAFCEWCLNNENPVSISGYSMPGTFKKIAEFKHRSILSATANNEVTERLYWNNKNH